MADPRPRLNSAIGEAIESGRFSGALLVRRAGDTVLELSHGFADLARRRQNTPDTAFQLASVSKQVTAAAILRLCDQQRLALHDRVERWLPGCLAAWRTVTVHQLLA